MKVNIQIGFKKSTFNLNSCHNLCYIIYVSYKVSYR